MIKKIFFALKTLSVLGMFLFAFPVLASWSDVPAGVTSATCPANVPGCNTPLNVSTSTQTKYGVLNMAGLTSGFFNLPTTEAEVINRTGSYTVILTGAYSYRYTVVIGGVEYASAISSVVNPVSTLNQVVKITLPGWNTTNNPAPLGATGIKLYRLSGSLWKVLNFTISQYATEVVDSGLSIWVSATPSFLEAYTSINNTLYYKNGTEGAGKVLTSDASGQASWQTLITGSGGYWTLSGLSLYSTALANKVIIGSDSISTNLDVFGTFKLTDGTQGANKVLTSDASGQASWQTPTTDGSGTGPSFSSCKQYQCYGKYSYKSDSTVDVIDTTCWDHTSVEPVDPPMIAMPNDTSSGTSVAVATLNFKYELANNTAKTDYWSVGKATCPTSEKVLVSSSVACVGVNPPSGTTIFVGRSGGVTRNSSKSVSGACDIKDRRYMLVNLTCCPS